MMYNSITYHIQFHHLRGYNPWFHYKETNQQHNDGQSYIEIVRLSTSLSNKNKNITLIGLSVHFLTTCCLGGLHKMPGN